MFDESNLIQLALCDSKTIYASRRYRKSDVNALQLVTRYSSSLPIGGDLIVPELGLCAVLFGIQPYFIMIECASVDSYPDVFVIGTVLKHSIACLCASEENVRKLDSQLPSNTYVLGQAAFLSISLIRSPIGIVRAAPWRIPPVARRRALFLMQRDDVEVIYVPHAVGSEDHSIFHCVSTLSLGAAINEPVSLHLTFGSEPDWIDSEVSTDGILEVPPMLSVGPSSPSAAIHRLRWLPIARWTSNDAWWRMRCKLDHRGDKCGVLFQAKPEALYTHVFHGATAIVTIHFSQQLSGEPMFFDGDSPIPYKLINNSTLRFTFEDFEDSEQLLVRFKLPILPGSTSLEAAVDMVLRSTSLLFDPCVEAQCSLADLQHRTELKATMRLGCESSLAFEVPPSLFTEEASE